MNKRQAKKKRKETKERIIQLEEGLIKLKEVAKRKANSFSRYSKTINIIALIELNMLIDVIELRKQRMEKCINEKED